MMPRTGWYAWSHWMSTFRPDGVGRIIIQGGGQAEVIKFTEIVCDWCNVDAGGDHEDGTEGRIFFNGSDSLCEECGVKAEKEAR